MPNNSHLDAIRGALILLVVWGHLLESEGFFGSFYVAIYVFHIPAFAIISGMLSKPSLNAQNLKNICARLLVPLVIFQIIYYVMLSYFAPDRLAGIYAPVWIIWFLFSLATWKLLLPLVLKLPLALLWSVIAALLVGYVDFVGPDFSLSRSFVFFPAFLFGHLYGHKTFQIIKSYRPQLSLIFLLVCCYALIFPDTVDIRWLWGSQPYSVMPHDAPSIMVRAGLILTGILTSIAFFALVPSKPQLLIALGRNTMPIFLLHGIPVVLFWSSGFQLHNHALFLILTLILAIAICFAILWASSRISARAPTWFQ